MGNRKTRRVTARYNWDRLKVSFWFAPVVMSLAAILLAWAMYWVDGRIPTRPCRTAVSSSRAPPVKYARC